MAWHKKCSLLLWNHHERSFTYCLLIQPAIWELSNTILFVVFGNFCNEVKYVGMSFQREGDIFSSLSFDSKFLWCLSQCHLTLICQKNLISESWRCSGFQFCYITLCLIVPLCLKISVHRFTVNFCILSQSQWLCGHREWLRCVYAICYIT